MVLRVMLHASLAEVVLSGVSGDVSRSLLQRSFHIRNAHSDITIRSSRVAPWRVSPFSDRTFRSGRAMIVVMSRPDGHAMFFLSHMSFAIFQIISHWFASQLNMMCCIVSGVSLLFERIAFHMRSSVGRVFSRS